MNEQTEIDASPEFLKGFNESYLLAQQNPELAAQLAKGITGTSERLEGFKKGHDQYVLENDKQFTLSWLPSNEKDEQKQHEQEMDKDDIEPEME